MAEMMVVVAIIAILAGVGIPVAVSAMNRAKETVCLQNLRGIGVGVQGYLRDHGDRLPVLQAGRKSKHNDSAAVMETELAEYLGSGAIYHCPAGTKEFNETGSSYLWNSTQNGRLMSGLSFFGIEAKTPELIPLVSDKEAWHPQGTNFLYADSSTSNKVRFGTAAR